MQHVGDGIFCFFKSCTRATLFHTGFGTLWLVIKLNDTQEMYQGRVQLNFEELELFFIMLNIRDLRIDPACLGDKMLLVEVVPAYEYKDNKRTDKVTGYRYVVCLVEHRLEKLSVRIDGPQLMESPDSFVEVLFSDLEVSGYESQGKVHFTAKASGIIPVK